jgi:hypothetical protein
MSDTIIINHTEQFITLNQLRVKNLDFFTLIASESPESQEQVVQDILAVGSAAMQRLRTTIDVDFVEKRFGTLAGSFEKALGDLEKRATDSVSKRFSPTESGSYTKQISDLIGDAKRDVQSWNRELENKAQALLDPDKKTSAIGKLDELIQLAASRFQQMFDPDVKNSYAFQLNEQISKTFGTNGHAGILQAALAEAFKPVFTELRELKEKVEAKKAAEQIIELSPIKGKLFEEQVQADLSQVAQQYGDDVQFVGTGSNGSRAGDFLIVFNGLGKKAVVEARNRRQISLPAIKNDLDHEIAERAADFGIYVSNGPEMLPQHVGEFQIYGNKIVVTQRNLYIAYRLARVLAAGEKPVGCVDVGGLRTLLARISDAARSMRDVKGKATQLRKLAEAIHSDADDSETMIVSLIIEAEKLLDPVSTPQSA